MTHKRKTALWIGGVLAAGMLFGAAALSPTGGTKRQTRGELPWEDFDGRVVFLGDSITELCDLSAYFPGLSAVNSGISGDTTAGILRRMDDAVWRYEPQIVVLLAGINDLLSGVEASTVVENLSAIVSAIHRRLPETKVIVQSIYPVHAWYGYAVADRIRAVNAEMKARAADLDFRYVELFDLLTDGTGDALDERYSDDGLHPSDEGYAAVQPAISAALGEAIAALS